MRRLIPVLAISVLVLAGTVATAQDGGPRAVPTEPIKDFETVPKGEVIVHEFEIKNEGSTDL